MPNHKRAPNCWRVKTKLERILILVLIVNAICITAILVFLLTQYQKGETSTTFWLPKISSSVCKTATCINEASQILNGIDTNINPCDDFYAFACKNSNLHQEGSFRKLLNEEKWQLQLLYNEPIRESDHQTVKLQKTLYKSCTNKTAAVKDSLRIVTDILRELGGWPVIVGHPWNDGNFDWLNTTYKLRERGYPYSIFLDLQVVPDTVIKDKYMFKIVIPEVHDVTSEFFDSYETNAFMMDVAVALGAELHRALPEMTETLQFLQDMQWLQKRNLLPHDKQPRRVTVTQFQREYGKIDWLEFINKIAGPEAKITSKDFVEFPPEWILDDWFELLLRSHKRTQANYMLWKVVEGLLPYLTEELHNRGVKPRLILEGHVESQSEFCVNEIEKRFVPSSLYVMYLRKFLGTERRRKVQQFMTNIKSELFTFIDEIEWKEDSYKQHVLGRVDGVIEIIGAPETYFDNEILDEIRVGDWDLGDGDGNNFLNLLSQANKDHWRRLYSLITKSVQDTRPWWFSNEYLNIEDFQDRVFIHIPANVLQAEVFNEKRPNYLNFGKLGVVLGPLFTKLLEISSVNCENATITDEWASYLECLVHEITNSTSNQANQKLFSELLGLKIANKLYTNWITNNKNQENLPLVDYTSKQLFWISSINLFCHYRNPGYITELLGTENLEIHSLIISKLFSSDRTIRSDFNCPELTVEEKNCKIL